MINSGKDLELFVKAVEETFLPEGFEVTHQNRVFNDEGVQVAELDVIIKGKLSTSFTWLIECRDRPSEGAAPSSWVEQLVGRRDRFKLDKVIAVSTTGFSPGAIKYAKDAGIEIRTIGEITEEDIRSWLSIQGMDFFNRSGTLLHVEIILDNPTKEQLKKIEKLLTNQDTNAPLLTHSGTGEKLSFLNAYQDAMRQAPNLYNDVQPDAEPIRKTLFVNYRNPDSRYMFELDDDNVHILKMHFVGDIFIKKEFKPFKKLTRYSIENTGEVISESAHVTLNINNDEIDLGIHNVKSNKGSKIVLTTKKEAKSDNKS